MYYKQFTNLAGETALSKNASSTSGTVVGYTHESGRGLFKDNFFFSLPL